MIADEACSCTRCVGWTSICSNPAASSSRRNSGKRYIDWDLPDPKGRPLNEVRAIRDDIRRRVGDLIDELRQPPSA